MFILKSFFKMQTPRVHLGIQKLKVRTPAPKSQLASNLCWPFSVQSDVNVSLVIKKDIFTHDIKFVFKNKDTLQSWCYNTFDNASYRDRYAVLTAISNIIFQIKAFQTCWILIHMKNKLMSYLTIVHWTNCYQHSCCSFHICESLELFKLTVV